MISHTASRLIPKILSRQMRRRLERRALRKRGGTNDAIMGMIIVGMTVTGISMMLYQQNKKVEDRATAVSFMIAADAAKKFMYNQHESIRREFSDMMTNGAIPGSQILFRNYDIADLVAAGALPGGLSGIDNKYNHDYELWVRAVRRSDTAWPQANLTKSSAATYNVPDANGNPSLFNGNYATGDDEVDLEAILISTGGTAIPMVNGGRIIEYTESLTTGVIYENPTNTFNASGLRGNFQLPGVRWRTLGAPLQDDHLLSLIWLSEANFSTSGGNDLRGALRRCDDIADTTERNTCIADGNMMYSDIIMTQRPSATTIAELPGLYGMKNVACRDKASSSFLSSQGGAAANSNLMLIDCSTVRFANDVSVGGDLTADTVTADTVTTDGLTLDGNDVFNNLVIASGTIANGVLFDASAVGLEACPAQANGAASQYKFDFWLNGMVETVGRSISGYRVYQHPVGDQQNATTGDFRMSVMAFVDEDHCRNVSGSTVTPIENATNGDFVLYGTAPNLEYVHRQCLPAGHPQAIAASTFKGTDSGGMVVGDGYPDVYRLLPQQAIISYQISCKAP